ncbi:MFS transporter [Desulforamulus ruminis]|uniref:Major facilitator superfamily MFS_1 n=1 Tax=Desulforamulus ruminis (strain ATCC 23193 / DSM 2154 / NCIMB 8452 / DL) TaxID=696281 RepID=F6DSV6_DESRL|nr:MFS transporter [Desulforamulus ruminis]AEG59950.1 major facilitator superfamily MFS_1 [Desulforamulus ruminis DSM 2154]
MNITISKNPGWKKRMVLFLLSQNISLFGSSVVGFAIIWHITLTTSSGTWLMLSTLCSMLPQVLVSLFGGVWADRYSRKHLIMLADGFIALATLGLAVVFLLGFERLELLLMVAAVRSIGAGIQTPAVGAIYPQLVPQEHLTKVQGINQTLNSVLMLLAPAVGGLILGSVGIVAAFFVDVVTATLAILVMNRIKVEKIHRQEASDSVWADLKSGLDYAYGHPQLRRIIICYLFSFFLITPAAVLSPLMVERTFGNEVWRLTANEMVWTVGSFFGGVFVSLKGQFKDKVRTVSLCLVAFGVMFGLLGAAWNFLSFLTFMGIAGFFLPPMATAQTVHIQEITKPEVLGRVFSIVQIISASAMPVAILLFGPLADIVSVESILIVSGILLALVGILYGRGRKDEANQ